MNGLISQYLFEEGTYFETTGILENTELVNKNVWILPKCKILCQIGVIQKKSLCVHVTWLEASLFRNKSIFFGVNRL